MSTFSYVKSESIHIINEKFQHSPWNMLQIVKRFSLYNFTISIFVHTFCFEVTCLFVHLYWSTVLLTLKQIYYIILKRFILFKIREASRGAAARSVTVKPTGCGFDPHSKRWNIYLNLYFHFFTLVSRLSAVLSSATQHAMPPEFGRKWGTEYPAVCGIQREAKRICQ